MGIVKSLVVTTRNTLDAEKVNIAENNDASCYNVLNALKMLTRLLINRQKRASQSELKTLIQGLT